MRMRQEKFKKSYYIPAFGKSIEIRRNQDIDEDGILGKELLVQYGEDCILEGETKSLMEKVASGDIGGSLTTEQTAAIEKINGLEASASEINGKVIPIDTIAMLRAKTVTPSTVWISGYYTKGDGAFGSNIFEWDSTSTETDNGGTIIKLTSITTGRYKLKYSGAVTPEMFGGLAEAINSGLCIKLKDNTAYVLENSFLQTDGQSLIGNNSIIKVNNSNSKILTINASDVTIDGVTFSGNNVHSNGTG